MIFKAVRLNEITEQWLEREGDGGTKREKENKK